MAAPPIGLIQGAPEDNENPFGEGYDFARSNNLPTDTNFFNALNRVRLIGNRAEAMVEQSATFRRRVLRRISDMRRLIYFMNALRVTLQASLAAPGRQEAREARGRCLDAVKAALAEERVKVTRALEPLGIDLLVGIINLLENPDLDTDQILAALQDAINSWTQQVGMLVEMLPADDTGPPDMTVPVPPPPRPSAVLYVAAACQVIRIKKGP